MLAKILMGALSISVVTVLIFNTATQFFDTYGVIHKGDFVILNLFLLLSMILAAYYFFLKAPLRIQIG